MTKKKTPKKKTVRKLPPQFQAVTDAYHRLKLRLQIVNEDLEATKIRAKEAEEKYACAREALDAAMKSPDLIAEQIKTWIPVLNRIGISVTLGTYVVTFTKGTISVSVNLHHLIGDGLHVIIDMFHAVKGNPVVCNCVDGLVGWEHPDVKAGEKDRALEEAAAILARGGLVPGENVTLRVPVLRDDCN